MTQKFQENGWIVRSIDSVSESAIHLVDFMKIDFEKHIGLIPDCLVLAPPCTTFSNLAGKCHCTMYG